MNIGLAMAVVSCVLLALVAGLLLLLGQLLRGMRRELREAPLLAEKLAQQLLAVRQGLEQARHQVAGAAHKLGPDLTSNLQAAQTMVNDLKFLIARAEQAAGKLEHGGRMEATVTRIVEKTIEVTPGGEVAGDPLETLLADLEDAAGTVTRRPSQAEVELRAKERN